jgi:hypothetical protein
VNFAKHEGHVGVLAMIFDDYEGDETFAEHDNDDALATLDAWTLNDFDDLLYGVKRSIASLSGGEEYGYASEL